MTVRDGGGREHRMLRSTATLNFFVNNVRLAGKEPEHLRCYLEMPADFDTRFMLAPSGYGLVVVDYVNNVVAGMQGYTALGALDGIGVEFDMASVHTPLGGVLTVLEGGAVAARGPGLGIFASADPMHEGTRAKRFAEFFDERRISGVARFGEGGQLLTLDHEWFQSLPVEQAAGALGRELRECIFGLDLSPFRVVNFEESGARAAREFRALVTGELGFVLSGEEERAWEEWIGRFDW